MATCRSCGAEIVWAITDKGKRIPLDARPAGPLFLLDVEPGAPPARARRNPFAGELHLSHFASCPDAREWSGRRRDG